jgi:hypothetical protein
MDALALTGTFAITAVVLVWSLWLAGQEGASRAWRLLTIALVPCVIGPAMTAAALSNATLNDVAHGVLFTFAALVSVGTLIHAGRAQAEEQAAEQG